MTDESVLTAREGAIAMPILSPILRIIALTIKTTVKRIRMRTALVMLATPLMITYLPMVLFQSDPLLVPSMLGFIK